MDTLNEAAAGVSTDILRSLRSKGAYRAVQDIDMNTVDLEIFGVKIFSSFVLATKIKNTKIYIHNT